ncbi:lipopolysaccharide heptosyltransferase II [Thiohalophilus thiocyanatoxydans]|uniref:lipopolysaccharide heptosyltransferase II n=1 Tax=Thiohalophilus thiocyanatoxydans TaxID=381308 RepID=A0A4R8IR28_9GAMM|nr:lipopolysaccharide heptosyltransferase II [Thiohalophilus thiocyanatoxydans]TDX99572.1 heptosyltransferase-2 [Thiohalophilus thiocyanatoxydans]
MSETSPSERLLVIGPAWVGDMVMAQSLFMTLKQQRGNPVIDVVAPKWSLPLLARMPEVHEGIPLPVQHGELGLGKRRALGHALRRHRYDQAIVLPRSFKAALVPWFARIPRRTGYRGELRYGFINDTRPLDKRVLYRTVERFVALGLDGEVNAAPSIPQPHLAVDPHNQQVCLEKLGLTTDKPIIAMMPGAEYGPAKRWPTAYYAELARKLVSQGKQVWVLGSQKESGLGEQIAVADGITNLCGRTELVDVVDLLALCDQAITNDSGLMHVACAAGTKVIAIYGSSDPAYTPPLSDKARIIYQGLDCSPCFERTCPLGHTNCLYTITPEIVAGEIG